MSSTDMYSPDVGSQVPGAHGTSHGPLPEKHRYQFLLELSRCATLIGPLHMCALSAYSGSVRQAVQLWTR